MIGCKFKPDLINSLQNTEWFTIIPGAGRLWGLRSDTGPFTGKMEIISTTPLYQPNSSMPDYAHSLAPMIGYFINGEISRHDGPALIVKHSDDTIRSENWICNGECHCETGPAIRVYNMHTQQTTLEQYYLRGKMIDKDKFYATIDLPLDIRIIACVLGGK